MNILTISNIVEENKIRIRDFLCLLHVAETYERKNDPETFNADGLSFHQSLQPNPFMTAIEKMLLYDEYGFAKLLYVLFVEGQEIQMAPSSYNQKGVRDIYLEIDRLWGEINILNSIMVDSMVKKRPWVLSKSIEIVLERIGYHILLNNIDKF